MQNKIVKRKSPNDAKFSDRGQEMNVNGVEKIYLGMIYLCVHYYICISTMSVCVHIYIFVPVYLSLYVYICAYICICIYNMSINMYVYAFIHTYLNIYMCMSIIIIT
jgi:hypothetical protein